MILERFGTVVLPVIEGEHDTGTAGSRSGLLALPSGGAFDAYGGEQSPRQARTLRLHGDIDGSASEIQTAIDALRAKRGRRDTLYMRMLDNSLRWTWARLLQIETQTTPDTVVSLPVDLTFELHDPIWYGALHGAGWTFDSGEFFDTGLTFDMATGDVFALSHTATTNISVVNDGNAAVDNAILEIAAGAGAITSVHITTDDLAITQADFTWTGTVPTGYSLLIDAGAQSIVVTNGTEGYNGLVFNAGHVISGWLRLMPGTTAMAITITSTTDATLTITFSDGWS